MKDEIAGVDWNAEHDKWQAWILRHGDKWYYDECFEDYSEAWISIRAWASDIMKIIHSEIDLLHKVDEFMKNKGIKGAVAGVDWDEDEHKWQPWLRTTHDKIHSGNYYDTKKEAWNSVLDWAQSVDKENGELTHYHNNIKEFMENNNFSYLTA